MRTAREIYETYNVPPWLQTHQVRVAAVGKMVGKELAFRGVTADVEGVVLAGLFHDMGNILKFTFAPDDVFASQIAEKGLQYWKGIQDEFRKKYGLDEHDATIAIMHELNLPPHVIGYAETVGFGKIPELLTSDSYEKKIVEYGDLRTGPFGIISVIQRQEDGYNRYAERFRKQGRNPEEYFANLRTNALQLEQQLFKHLSMSPEDVNDVSISTIMKELWDYEVA